MEALSVAYGISIQIYMVIEQHETEASESAAAGWPVTA
jgi:hypothetical protein